MTGSHSDECSVSSQAAGRVIHLDPCDVGTLGLAGVAIGQPVLLGVGLVVLTNTSEESDSD